MPKEKVEKPVKPRRKIKTAVKPNIMTAPVLCCLYPLAALLVILAYRFFFPVDFWAEDAAGRTRFLPIYRTARIFVTALLNWIEIFPALILSALVMPFGLKPAFETPEKRFSAAFIMRIKPAIFAAMCSAAFFAFLTLLARPALYNYESNMRANSTVYYNAYENAGIYAEHEDWIMAQGFLALCKKIWPKDNPELKPLEAEIFTGREQLLYGMPKKKAVENEKQARAITGEKQPLNATRAVELANRALDENRFYDAHWLATLAVRIARPGSVESSAGQRIASWSWNRISLLEPNADDVRLNSMYRQKRAGYEAMVAEDWIRAYYIFHELLALVPGDPDVAKFHEMSREELGHAAFFIDEMNTTTGDEIENAVFSIPRLAEDGRLVFRAGYLFTMKDESYASGIEMAAFDHAGKPVFRVETPFAKIMPIYVNGIWRTVVLLRAIDRDDERIRWEPLWIDETLPTGTKQGAQRPANFAQAGERGPGGYEVLLDISYENFLLAQDGINGLPSFFLADFWKASSQLNAYGFAPEVFYAEILSTLGKPLLFLPLAVFIIAIGWRFRSRHSPPYAGFPMAVILPLVFHVLLSLVFTNGKNLYIILILQTGFTAALVLAIALPVVFLVISLLFLAAQHG
ncbi:MAG: hypothetical protein LBG74_02630 [Spirochaetaceae bacterium]|jgi:hypothetical protein|nr:hypothetical protein [Spirochaetaceae bacterium]